LLRVATGLRSGSTIKKGQLIGYVGSSGLSNGSHLHFELYKNGDYIDPLSFEFPAEDQIEPALLKVFETRKQLFLAEMAAAPNS
jgi:murein DD-endopeptidase MepM/ murein hydrolase activator NlpD